MYCEWQLLIHWKGRANNTVEMDVRPDESSQRRGTRNLGLQQVRRSYLETDCLNELCYCTC